MADGADLEIPVTYVRWDVNTRKKPDDDKRIRSSEFRFLKNEWRLGFCYESKVHCLRLETQNEEFCYAPFGVSVHVEDSGTDRILPQLSGIKAFKGGFRNKINGRCYWPLWQKSDADIEQADPECARNYYKLRFLVVLRKQSVLADTDSRETQTECSVQEAAGQSISTRSTSVQTTLHPNVTLCLESLSQDLARLMTGDSVHDVEFQCAGQSTKAHKLIVCQRSPVIASMLSSDMVEGRTGVVNIPNMESDIFTQFMKYIYSGQLEELTFEVALRLYEAGDQYAVHSLAKRCSKFLLEHLSVDNACEVLVVADAHSNKDFVEKVIDYMVDNRVPLVSEGWSAFCDEHSKLANKVLNRGWKVFAK